MRVRAGLVVALLVVGACRPVSDPAGPGQSGTTTAPSTSAASVPEGPIRGALPDGTVYDVIREPPLHEEITGVSAGVMVGSRGEVAEVGFHRDGGGPTGWSGSRYRTRAEDWTAEVRFSERAWAGLGDDPRATVEDSLRLSVHLGLPVVELSPPLRWADDERALMQVAYQTFAVRRGCPEGALACNPTHAVGAVPREAGRSGQATDMTVLSYALRRPSDPHYVDPGPLPGRSGHDLLWSGEEMIVWGGTAPRRVDGAAFRPQEGTWRMLPDVPLRDGEQVTRAVWAEERMIVVSAEATLAYHPGADSWARLGEGGTPPDHPDRMVWTGHEVFTWTEEGMRAFRPEGEGWVDLPAPGAPGVLRVWNGRLYAVGAADCDRRAVTEWEGERWREVAAVPAGEDCPLPQQMAAAGDRLVTWRDRRHPTWIYQASRQQWEETEPIPLSPVERPSGPLLMEERLLVPRGQEGAIFHPRTGRWTPVDLPGHGREETMVWTGEEVLAWDRCCYEPDDVDAWRWTPPDD